jgi:hypothetical protein
MGRCSPLNATHKGKPALSITVRQVVNDPARFRHLQLVRCVRGLAVCLHREGFVDCWFRCLLRTQLRARPGCGGARSFIYKDDVF